METKLMKRYWKFYLNNGGRRRTVESILLSNIIIGEQTSLSFIHIRVVGGSHDFLRKCDT